MAQEEGTVQEPVQEQLVAAWAYLVGEMEASAGLLEALEMAEKVGGIDQELAEERVRLELQELQEEPSGGCLEEPLLEACQDTLQEAFPVALAYLLAQIASLLAASAWDGWAFGPRTAKKSKISATWRKGVESVQNTTCE